MKLCSLLACRVWAPAVHSNKHPSSVLELLPVLKARPLMCTEGAPVYSPSLHTDPSVKWMWQGWFELWAGDNVPMAPSNCPYSWISASSKARKSDRRAAQYQAHGGAAGEPQFKSEHKNSWFSINAQTNPAHPHHTVTSWLVKPMCKFVPKYRCSAKFGKSLLTKGLHCIFM